MKTIFLILAIFSIHISADAEEPGVCGGTFQSFWQIEPNTKLLRMKAFYRHPDVEFCEKSVVTSPNAEIQLMTASHDVVRKFNSYLPITLFQDHAVKGQLHGAIGIPKAQIIQIKFADDVAFKKVKFIKIIFSDGSAYGPASL